MISTCSRLHHHPLGQQQAASRTSAVSTWQHSRCQLTRCKPGMPRVSAKYHGTLTSALEYGTYGHELSFHDLHRQAATPVGHACSLARPHRHVPQLACACACRICLWIPWSHPNSVTKKCRGGQDHLQCQSCTPPRVQSQCGSSRTGRSPLASPTGRIPRATPSLWINGWLLMVAACKRWAAAQPDCT